MNLKRSSRVTTRSNYARCPVVLTADPFLPQRNAPVTSTSASAAGESKVEAK